MTSPAPSQPQRRRFWPMPMIVSWRRFGMAIIGASSLILVVGFVLHFVYRAQPPITPVTARQAGAVFEKASSNVEGGRASSVWSVIAGFVEALEKQDQAAMSDAFPAMTSREARILLAIRKRLGERADLRLERKRMTVTSGSTVHADFVIVATQRDNERERRLPFSATLAEVASGTWTIVRLR